MPDGNAGKCYGGVANDAELPKGAHSYVPARQPPSPRIHIGRPVEQLALVAHAPKITADASSARPFFIRSNISLPRWAVLVIVALWLGGAGLALVRLAASLLHFESLKRDALPLSVAYRAGLPRWSVAVKGGRDVRLCIFDAIDIPISIGLLDAMIFWFPCDCSRSFRPGTSTRSCYTSSPICGARTITSTPPNASRSRCTSYTPRRSQA